MLTIHPSEIEPLHGSGEPPLCPQTLETSSAATLTDLGARLRSLRLEKSLTLAELSERSAVSVGMISHIERGKTSPSLKTLERLRLSLDVPLASFFAPLESGPAEAPWVVRAAGRRQLSLDRIGLVKEMLSPASGSGLEVLMLVLAPGGSSGPEPWVRAGEKAGLVLQGRFELTVGESVQVLEPGDSFQFDSRQLHSFRNLAATESRVVWILKSDEPG